MLTTTLNRIRIRASSPWQSNWIKLLASLGKTTADDEPLSYAKIFEIIGLYGTLFLCRAEPQHAKEWRLFGVWCARQAQHLMTDQRSVEALDVAERYANGLATDEELADAWTSAWTSAGAAARDAWNYALNAWEVGDYRSANLATRANFSAVWGAALAARAAWTVTQAAAWDAAYDASYNAWSAEESSKVVMDAQKSKFLEIVS